MTAALEGLTVVDITQGIAGPQCTKHLGDAGALVVKMEPLAGDVARTWGPPFEHNESAPFVELNRNKRSMAIDLLDDKGLSVFLRFVESADVLVHDKTPAEVAKVGISYSRLQALNPRLVYCSVTPFGEEGPYRDHSGSELVIQAMTDYLTCMGRLPDAPARMGFDMAQMNAGIFAFQAIMAALYRRSRTGEGGKVACSWFGTLLHLRGLTWAAHTDPDAWGGQHHDLYTDPPRHGYRSKDGEIMLTLGRITREGWDHLCKQLGLQDIVNGDPRFDNEGRESVGVGLHAQELRSVWEKAFEPWPRKKLLKLLHSVGANAVPVNSYEDLVNDEQVQTVDMVRVLHHPYGGPQVTTGVPWKLSETPSAISTPAPRLGEHTQELLKDWGFTDDEIDEMDRGGGHQRALKAFSV